MSVYNIKTLSEGVEFYNKMIDSLIENGIEPMVTLFHWDLPQKLQDSNGGQISDEFPNWFADYADFCFRTFGDRVKKWLTFNEPYINSQCYENASIHCAPGVISPGVKSYINGHHEILAHVKTYHLYKKKYFKEQGGKVGIVIGDQKLRLIHFTKFNLFIFNKRALTKLPNTRIAGCCESSIDFSANNGSSN